MNLEEEIQKEIERLNNLGYQVIDMKDHKVLLEKHVLPSKLKVIAWVFISLGIPIIGLILLLSPMRIVYFFKGQKYEATIQVVNGEIETT